MALAEGDDRVTVSIVTDARRFKIGEHRPDHIHRSVAGHLTEIQSDKVDHLAAAGLEIGNHIGPGLGFKDETITTSAIANRIITNTAI